MVSNWPEYPLTDFYDISSGLSKPAADFGSGHPFVSFKDVFGNYFLPDELVQLVQSTDQERKKCSVKRGDVFLTRTSETMHELGMSSVALRDYENATFNGFTKRLRPKPDCELVPEYVGYYLRSPRFRHSMLAFSTMSTRASLNNEMIGRLTIEVPPRPVQQSIAHVLKTLDEKVALNRQMNETLEQMAQALFKSWFVDFDPVIDNALDAGNPIPEELEARAEQRRQLRNAVALGEASAPSLPDEIRSLFPSEFELTDDMGWIPKGWAASTVGNVVNRLKVKKRYKKQDVEKFGIIPVYEQGSDIVLGYHNASPDLIADANNPIFIFGDHTCVTELSIRPFSISANVIPLEGKGFSTYWVYYAIQGKQKFEEYRRHWMEFIIKPLVLPSINIAEEFSKIVLFYSYRKEALRMQSVVLEDLRDSLLPKLISGELQIPDAEQQSAEVMS